MTEVMEPVEHKNFLAARRQGFDRLHHALELPVAVQDSFRSPFIHNFQRSFVGEGRRTGRQERFSAAPSMIDGNIGCDPEQIGARIPDVRRGRRPHQFQKRFLHQVGDRMGARDPPRKKSPEIIARGMKQFFEVLDGQHAASPTVRQTATEPFPPRDPMRKVPAVKRGRECSISGK
ncbi:MAG: hypothetical protein LZF60_420054 [Nitrospira sp.]|nr:MAG: hypothetical protein LZF60_420054 [Nitrospira sp.]